VSKRAGAARSGAVSSWGVITGVIIPRMLRAGVVLA
jgi:hypothetical protein